jgi:hypothetical protein
VSAGLEKELRERSARLYEEGKHRRVTQSLPIVEARCHLGVPQQDYMPVGRAVTKTGSTYEVCVRTSESDSWEALRLRPDKELPNDVRTFHSVCLSIKQQVDQAELVRTLSSTGPVGPVNPFSKVVVIHPERADKGGRRSAHPTVPQPGPPAKRQNRS